MTLQVTLTISERVVENAQRVAQEKQQPLEAVLAEWLDRAAEELPVEALSDKELLSLCDSQLPVDEQVELSTLLVENREGTLDATKRAFLDHLMQKYDAGLLRKAQALREAVKRGLRDSLS